MDDWVIGEHLAAVLGDCQQAYGACVWSTYVLVSMSPFNICNCGN